MTAENKKFTLTDHTARLQKVRYLKKAPPKPRKNAKGDDVPVASAGDEDVLKAKLGLYVDTQEHDILKCFTESDNQDLFQLLVDNKNIPAIVFTNHILNYWISINEALEADNVDLSDFKATTYINADGVRLIRLYFNATFCIDGRMVALLSEFWKEEINLSLEPSDNQP